MSSFLISPLSKREGQLTNKNDTLYGLSKNMKVSARIWNYSDFYFLIVDIIFLTKLGTEVLLMLNVEKSCCDIDIFTLIPNIWTASLACCGHCCSRWLCKDQVWDGMWRWCPYRFTRSFHRWWKVSWQGHTCWSDSQGCSHWWIRLCSRRWWISRDARPHSEHHKFLAARLSCACTSCEGKKQTNPA